MKLTRPAKLMLVFYAGMTLASCGWWLATEAHRYALSELNTWIGYGCGGLC